MPKTFYNRFNKGYRRGLPKLTKLALQDKYKIPVNSNTIKSKDEINNPYKEIGENIELHKIGSISAKIKKGELDYDHTNMNIKPVLDEVKESRGDRPINPDHTDDLKDGIKNNFTEKERKNLAQNQLPDELEPENVDDVVLVDDEEQELPSKSEMIPFVPEEEQPIPPSDEQSYASLDTSSDASSGYLPYDELSENPTPSEVGAMEINVEQTKLEQIGREKKGLEMVAFVNKNMDRLKALDVKRRKKILKEIAEELHKNMAKKRIKKLLKY